MCSRAQAPGAMSRRYTTPGTPSRSPRSARVSSPKLRQATRHDLAASEKAQSPTRKPAQKHGGGRQQDLALPIRCMNEDLIKALALGLSQGVILQQEKQDAGTTQHRHRRRVGKPKSRVSAMQARCLLPRETRRMQAMEPQWQCERTHGSQKTAWGSEGRRVVTAPIAMELGNSPAAASQPRNGKKLLS